MARFTTDQEAVMRDLSRLQAALSPSSMNAGNTTSDDAKITQTAPGSTSVLPVPEPLDVLPQVQVPAAHDFAPMITHDSPDRYTPRPAESAATLPGESGGGWSLVRDDG
jgi:hypothetical protein